MVKRNVIATKLTKICTQTPKRAFDVAVPFVRKKYPFLSALLGLNDHPELPLLKSCPVDLKF